MAGGISVHAVDVAQGVPANGLGVGVYRLLPLGEVCIAEGILGPQGTLDHPVTRGDGVEIGSYEIRLQVGDWWRSLGDTAPCFFQETVVFRFEVFDTTPHYHLPIKFTKWGFAMFRGA